MGSLTRADRACGGEATMDESTATLCDEMRGGRYTTTMKLVEGAGAGVRRAVASKQALFTEARSHPAPTNNGVVHFSAVAPF